MALACSSNDKQYAPAANNDCSTPPCGASGVVSGGGTGTGGTSGVVELVLDGGVVTVGGEFTNCNTDPTSGVTLCSNSSICPDVQIDTVNFSNCGFDLFLGGKSDGGVPVLHYPRALPACRRHRVHGYSRQADERPQRSGSVCNAAVNCRSVINGVGGAGGAGGAGNCRDAVCLSQCAAGAFGVRHVLLHVKRTWS